MGTTNQGGTTESSSSLTREIMAKGIFYLFFRCHESRFSVHLNMKAVL
jgi:hypothetical protein